MQSTTKRNSHEQKFRSEASQVLEKWAADAQVQGKLLKKEGQKYSHEVEEVEKGGKKSSKAIGRRIIRRGSRRLSRGGEMITETKEVASSGDPTSNDSDTEREYVSALEPYAEEKAKKKKNDMSRKMKSSTDGERYVTESVQSKDGIRKTTTTGVDNKTIKSHEIIGGKWTFLFHFRSSFILLLLQVVVGKARDKWLTV